MNHFCTIATQDHLYKVFALHHSLSQNSTAPFHLHVLLTDGSRSSNQQNITFSNLQQISSPIAQAIQKKYRGDKLRWSMKPVWIGYLLEKLQSLVYIDNDIAFFADPTFLFDELVRFHILLTPHRYPVYAQKDQYWLENHLKYGLFNAGFVGVHQRAKNIIAWWAECCLYKCEKNYWRGLYDDQKYLDLFPVLEPKTKILEHKGCNVAGWNIANCPRTIIDGKVMAGDYPIVFIHFNFFTIRMIIEGKDPLLQPFWEQYFDSMKKFNSNIRANDFYRPLTLIDKLKLAFWKAIS